MTSDSSAVCQNITSKAACESSNGPHRSNNPYAFQIASASPPRFSLSLCFLVFDTSALPSTISNFGLGSGMGASEITFSHFYPRQCQKGKVSTPRNKPSRPEEEAVESNPALRAPPNVMRGPVNVLEHRIGHMTAGIEYKRDDGPACF